MLDRPGLSDILGRLAFYALALGMREALPYAHDDAIELARMSPPSDAAHYVAHGLSLLTPVHPCFLASELSQRGLCLAMSHALALGLEHFPATGPAETTAPPLDVEEENSDCEGIVRWRQNPPPPRPRPKAGSVADAAPEPQAPGVVVFLRDAVEIGGRGETKRDVERFLGPALGARLPLVPVPENRDYWENAANIESPWLAPFTRAVRLSQGNRTQWGHAVICAVGAPGAGKTHHVRRIAEVSKLPFARFNCEATSDNSMGGTSIRWQTGHPSFIECLLAGEGKASGMALLDEIEKSSGGRRSNGGDPSTCATAGSSP